MSKIPTAASACPYVVGDDGLASWSDRHAGAWIGLLEAHKQLTRALDAELEAQHGLSLSALELLGRLAAADRRQLRLSVLAHEAGLSLSRVSRIIDVLEGRGLVERQTCPQDARAVEAHLTERGLSLAREAQSALGEVCFDRPCILRAGLTLDEPAAFEHIDDPRHAAEAEARLVSEHREPKLTTVSRRQTSEQLEGAEAQPVLCLQLGVECAGELLVSLEQADPSPCVPV